MRYNTKLNDKILTNTGIWTNLSVQTGTHCNASTIFSDEYPCDAAIDGFISHGPNNEWASSHEGAGAWIKVSIIR